MKLTKIPWTPLVEVFDPVYTESGQKLFVNSRYQIVLRNAGTHEPFGTVAEMSIKRRDKQPIYDWRDIQKIKNELFHPEATAIQIFPPEKHLMDTSNHYWFYVMEYEFPLGFKSRLLNGESIHKTCFGQGAQRPFNEEHKPADLAQCQEVFAKQAATLQNITELHDQVDLMRVISRR